MRAILRRVADSPFGVFAYLDLMNEAGQRVLRLCAGEDDWLGNKPQISCIPAGKYLCKRKVSPHFGETFEVTGVPGRGDILFHEGNTEENTQGCILLGLAFGSLSVADEDDPAHPVIVKWGVVSSKIARQRFMLALVGVATFEMEVRWAQPGEWR